MGKIIYEDSYEAKVLPEDHEYRGKNGTASLDYLLMMTKVNKRVAREFEVSLNALSANFPTKNVTISWKIEEHDE